MIFSTSQKNKAIPPGAENSAYMPSPRRASFARTNSASQPLASSPVPPDQVHFGRSKKAHPTKTDDSELPEVQPSQTTDKTSMAQNSTAKKKGKTDQPQAPNREYGHTENNLREAARIVLCDIAPLGLSVLPMVGIPGLGFAFALASLPMSYASGKLGRHMAKNVDPDNLNPAFQYFHKVKKALKTSPAKDGHGNVVDKINQATDDLLSVRNMPSFLSTTLLPMLKVKPGSGAAKLLTKVNSMALMRAEVNIRLAQAENRKDAGKAMFNGVKDFAVYSGMNKLGTALTASSIPGAKIAGEFLKNAAWVKIAADLLHAKEKKPENATAKA
jgi:hypothetical protein